jgi:Fic family protein
MNDLFEILNQKKKELDRCRSLSAKGALSLEEWLDVELTYTSNAIEGNTLSRMETALVIEKGLTVEGKSLREHLEAVNHKKALELIRELADKKHSNIQEIDILRIHGLILKGIDDEWAGRYRQSPVRISGSQVVLPNYRKVPFLMKDFMLWLRSIKGEHPVKIASDAHYKLVSIHPWVDGNGRSARLLMNLILIRNGYVPAIIKKEERRLCLESLEEAQLGGSLDKFYRLMIRAEERTLDIYIQTAREKDERAISKKEENLKIGELKKSAGVAESTIRYYVEKGLIVPVGHTKGGFMLFSPQTAETIKEIKRLQKEERLSIKEIKNILKKQVSDI